MCLLHLKRRKEMKREMGRMSRATKRQQALLNSKIAWVVMWLVGEGEVLVNSVLIDTSYMNKTEAADYIGQLNRLYRDEMDFPHSPYISIRMSDVYEECLADGRIEILEEV